MIEFLAALPDAVALGFRALAFDARVFDRAGQDATTWDLAALLVFVAGISSGTGHATVLFLNHVTPLRFALCLALTGLTYLAGAIVSALCTTVLADTLFDQSVGFAPLFAVIALAHAPRLLGVLTMAPYAGEAFDRVLDIWVMALLLFGIYHGVDAPFGIAAAAAAAGWLTVRALSMVLGRPLTWAIGGLRRRAAGRPLDLDLTDIVEELKARARDLIGRGDDRR